MKTIKIIGKAETKACGCDEHSDWCAVCGRVTCHFGEHSTTQLLAYAERAGVAKVDPKALRNAEIAEKWFEAGWMRRNRH